MRAEELDKSKLVAMWHDGTYDEKIVSSNVEIEHIENEAKKYKQGFIESIHYRQRALKSHGYILFQDNVYKVHSGTTIVNKITGKEAKEIKQMMKPYLPVNKHIEDFRI